MERDIAKLRRDNPLTAFLDYDIKRAANKYKDMELNPAIDGNGEERSFRAVMCDHCGGTGAIEADQDTGRIAPSTISEDLEGYRCELEQWKERAEQAERHIAEFKAELVQTARFLDGQADSPHVTARQRAAFRTAAECARRAVNQ